MRTLPPRLLPDHSAIALHKKAKRGDPAARQGLMIWAFESASDYYQGKIAVERSMDQLDADDLAAMFCLEFERAWPRMESLLNYTRRMLRNNLNRFLRLKRRRDDRERCMSNHVICEVFDGAENCYEDAEEDPLDDRRWLKLRVIEEVLRTTDPITRTVLELRCQDPAVSYREMAPALESTETALRMRAARFYKTVREVHGRSRAPELASSNTVPAKAPGPAGGGGGYDAEEMPLAGENGKFFSAIHSEALRPDGRASL